MNTKFQWLWLWVLGLLALLGVWMISSSPDAARPAAIHRVAAAAGEYVGFALFAALLAACVKLLTSAQWSVHQWANVTVVLVLTIVIARAPLSTRGTVTGAPLPSEKSVLIPDLKSAGAEGEIASRLVGVWKCKAGKTRGSINDLMVIGSDGYVYSLSTGGGDGSPIYAGSWRVEGGSTYVHTLGGSPDNPYRGIVGRYRLSNLEDASVTFGDDDGFSCVRR